MNGAFYVGAVGLEAQQRALDVIAGNIANVNTPAFKRSAVRFASMVASHADNDLSTASLDSATAQTAGVHVTAERMVDESGPVEATGQAMDVAINGHGFIELMGPDGRSVLWRGGTLRVDADGRLCAANGLPLQAAISVPSDATGITIAGDGTVTATVSGDAAPTEIGQIDLVKVDDLQSLTTVDGDYLEVPEGITTTAGRPGEDGLGRLTQGSLERSNVEMTSEMVQLMITQRAYGANAQILQAADQLMAMANSLRR